jgi:hypothetical protein
LVGLPYFLPGPDLAQVLLSLGSVASTTIGVPAGHLAPLGRVEGLPGPPALPVRPYTAPAIEGLLSAVPLYMAPFLVLEVLLRL